MTDESTDIAVKKQLVLVARYLVRGHVTTAFITISDGTADTILQGILSINSSKRYDRLLKASPGEVYRCTSGSA